MSILVVVAHPDDEVLGCGGTIAKISSQEEVTVLILGEGVASRDLPEKNKELGLTNLKKEAEVSNRVLGVKKVFFENFPDNKFDTVALLDIIKVIERYVKDLKPKEIYTHHGGDLNIDHQITNRAVLTATRPLSGCSVKKIFAFEVLSSTEWSKQIPGKAFIPNIYVDISDSIDKKLESMKTYGSELREPPHPRSLEGIKILAQRRGLEAGLSYAESFCLIREIR